MKPITSGSQVYFYVDTQNTQKDAQPQTWAHVVPNHVTKFKGFSTDCINLFESLHSSVILCSPFSLFLLCEKKVKIKSHIISVLSCILFCLQEHCTKTNSYQLCVDMAIKYLILCEYVNKFISYRPFPQTKTENKQMPSPWGIQR